MRPLFILIFALLATFWGSNFMYMKWATVVISPEQTVFIRSLCGAIPLFAYAFWKGLIKREHARYWHHYFILSTLTISFAYYGYAAGTELLPSGIAGMLTGSIPLFTFVASYFLLKSEVINTRKAIGTLVGFIGIILIAKPWADAGEISLMGVFYMLAGSLSIGLSYIYARRTVSGIGISAIALAAYQLGFAALTMAFFIDYSTLPEVFSSTKVAWGTILGLGVIGTGGAYMLYYYLLEHMGVIAAASATYLPPIVATFIGFFILHEAIHILDLVAMVSILFGVLLLRETKPKPIKA